MRLDLASPGFGRRQESPFGVTGTPRVGLAERRAREDLALANWVAMASPGVRVGVG